MPIDPAEHADEQAVVKGERARAEAETQFSDSEPGYIRFTGTSNFRKFAKKGLHLRLLAKQARSRKLSDEEARVWRNRRLLDTELDGLKKGDVVVIPNLPAQGPARACSEESAG